MNRNTFFYILLISIMVFAFLPDGSTPNFLADLHPHIKHFFAFFTVSFYLYYFKHYSLIAIVLFSFGFGLFIEISQELFFTTREFSWKDLLFDMIGCAAFLFVNLFVRSR